MPESSLQCTEELITEKREQPKEGGGEPRWVRHSSSLMDVTKAADWSLADGSGAELPIELPASKARAESVLADVLQDGGSRL